MSLLTESFSGEGWEIRSGRWEFSQPDSVDVVITDPPFTDRVSLNARGNAQGYGKSKRLISSFMGVNAPAAWVPNILSIANRWVLCFCAHEQAGDYEAAVGQKEYIRTGAWVKTNPPPQFSGDRPAEWGESVAIMHSRPARLRWNGGGHPARWTGPSNHGSQNGAEVRVHETQKPLWLMLKLVELFSEPGELIWDPFGGSMTTGVAALRLGRRFLGHESQNGACDCPAGKECPHEVKPYVRIGVERLRAEERGLSLKAASVGQMSIWE